MIRYYKAYGDAAQTDIVRLTQELASTDAEQAQAWGDIMDYWDYVNSDMEVHTDVLPDGLPTDDTLCITVLGYALNADGTMKDELIGRLQVALDSAAKYPNAYIACTGGGTAAQNPSATEADQMAAWLIGQGVDEERIIVENRSKSTVQNAQLTYALLRKQYPQITDLAIITSDYHVPRGCLLYNAQLILSAQKAKDTPLKVISNAGYKAGHGGYEAVSLQASGIAQIAGVSLGSAVPTLSKLTAISVEGTQQYSRGDALALQVTATYDNGFSRDVTEQSVIVGYDPEQIGRQFLIVTYEENGITQECNTTVQVKGSAVWLIVLGVTAAVLVAGAAVIVCIVMKKKANT